MACCTVDAGIEDFEPTAIGILEGLTLLPPIHNIKINKVKILPQIVQMNNAIS